MSKTKYHAGPDFGIGDVIELAESLGWEDPDIQPWSPEAADETERSALEHIAQSGIEIVEQEVK